MSHFPFRTLDLPGISFLLPFLEPEIHSLPASPPSAPQLQALGLSRNLGFQEAENRAGRSFQGRWFTGVGEAGQGKAWSGAQVSGRGLWGWSDLPQICPAPRFAKFFAFFIRRDQAHSGWDGHRLRLSSTTQRDGLDYFSSPGMKPVTLHESNTVSEIGCGIYLPAVLKYWQKHRRWTQRLPAALSGVSGKRKAPAPGLLPAIHFQPTQTAGLELGEGGNLEK